MLKLDMARTGSVTCTLSMTRRDFLEMVTKRLAEGCSSKNQVIDKTGWLKHLVATSGALCVRVRDALGGNGGSVVLTHKDTIQIEATIERLVGRRSGSGEKA